MKNPHLIGRRDFVDLPEIGLFDIEAKIDTGAYGCALHCHHVEVIRKGEKEVLQFKVLDPSHPEYKDKVLESEDFDQKIVKSSSGVPEKRFTIRTEIVIFDKKEKATFSLADREAMKYPILIGRKFLKSRFLVDVSKKNLSFEQKHGK